MNNDSKKLRSIIQKISGQRTTEGGGLPILRPFPTRILDHVDPFLLFDEAGPVMPKATDGDVDMNDHPHRGFETLTYVLEGELDSHDSSGFHDYFYPGDVEWTTAGGGIIHGGAPRPGSGAMHGIQLWINLPRAQKWIPAKSQRIAASTIPNIERDGYNVKILGGSVDGVEGPVKTTWPITYLHYTLKPNGNVSIDIPEEENAILWVLNGEVSVQGARIGKGELGITGYGERIEFTNPRDSETELVLLAGKPIGEPVARYGPFVMNERDEVFQAFDDFNAGKFAPIVK
jgi:redox-sensitive bicupin YhaK (pirin superfamily)